MTLSDASLLKLIAAGEVSNAGTMFLYQFGLSWYNSLTVMAYDCHTNRAVRTDASEYTYYVICRVYMVLRIWDASPWSMPAQNLMCTRSTTVGYPTAVVYPGIGTNLTQTETNWRSEKHQIKERGKGIEGLQFQLLHSVALLWCKNILVKISYRMFRAMLEEVFRY
jgi:hypothetical protein